MGPLPHGGDAPSDHSERFVVGHLKVTGAERPPPQRGVASGLRVSHGRDGRDEDQRELDRSECHRPARMSNLIAGRDGLYIAGQDRPEITTSTPAQRDCRFVCRRHYARGARG